MLKRLGVCAVGVTVGTAAMLFATSARADERHCIDTNIKAAVLSKLGAAGQHTDLAVAGGTLDATHTVSGEIRGTTVVVSSATSAQNLQINTATDSGLDVLVCVYGRETTAAWRATKSPSNVHGSLGSDASSNKVNQHFVLDPSRREATYGYANRADSSQPSDRVVAVVLTPTKGTAKYAVGLNRAVPPFPAPPLGVDRGDFFSENARAAMQKVHEPNRSLCLRAVKRTLFKTGALKDWEDPTEHAKDFVAVMRDPQKVRGYREVTQAELKYDYTKLRALKDRLPVGTVIVYRNNTPGDEKAPSPVHGHIEVVAKDSTGAKALISDHVAPYDHGWAWLSASNSRNIDMWIFVPTEVNRTLVADPIDLRTH
jgi:hypothetical protein